VKAGLAVASTRYDDGARIVAQPASGVLPAGHDLLFLVRADGQLAAVTQTGTPAPEAGDTMVSLGPACGPALERARGTVSYHVRLVSASGRADVLLEALASGPGVWGLVVLPGATQRPGGVVSLTEARAGALIGFSPRRFASGGSSGAPANGPARKRQTWLRSGP